MGEDLTEKMVIVATHGSEDPELATIPFVMANAALAMDVSVTVILQASGVTLVQRGIYENITAPNFEPLKKLVDGLLELGGRIMVCIPCLNARNITEDMLVTGAELVKAGSIVQECLEAKTVANY